MRHGYKKWIRPLQFLLLAIFISQCYNFAKTANNSYAKEPNKMFSLEGSAYPVEYANYQLNSHVSSDCRAKGNILWAKAYSEANENFMLTPRSVLIKDDNIGVLSTENLLTYKPDGSFQYMLPIGSNTPVVFGKEAMAYLVPANLLNYQDYSGKLILETGEFPSLEEWAHVVLFKPEKNEFIAAVHFTGGPKPMRQPQTFDVYRKQIKKSLVKWRYDGDGTLDRAFLTTDNRKILIIQGSKASLLDTVNIQVESDFDLGFEDIETASLDTENNLVFIGRGAKNKGVRPYLTKLSLSGKVLWEYELRNPQTHQPPVSGSTGQAYVVDVGQLKSIDKGELKWELTLKSKAQALMTVTKDDSVILLQGSRLSFIESSGSEKFSMQLTTEEEDFDAPPSVDSQGRIYVASDKKLYCIE